MFYADDSGNLDRGWIVYGWLELETRHWDSVLDYWLKFRRDLVGEFGVPVAKELHATDFVNGRREISTSMPARYKSDARWKQTLGRELAVACLETLRDCPYIELGSAYLVTTRRGEELTEDRELAYAKLVALWDEQLKRSDDYGIVGMDGEGTDPVYYRGHRALDLKTRRIVEDPMFHSSKRSQWTQMADLVAWTSFTHLYRHDANEYAWGWYDTYLDDKCPMGPIDLATLPSPLKRG